MSTLAQIRGQSRAAKLLSDCISAERIPHAFLFTGPEHAGKYTTALAFARAVNCLERPGEGCDSCSACTRIADQRHPDVITLQRQGAAQIVPLESIRTEVIALLALPPHEARRRFFLFEEATALPPPSANALLKSLEEPPARTHFILCTQAPANLLPTIRSRCQRVAFQAPPAVRAELEGDEAGAIIARDLELLENAAVSGSRADVFDAASEVASHKEQVADVLRALLTRYHRGAVEAATSGDDARAQRFANCAAHVLDAETAVELHNAHKQLALEHLLLRLVREQPGRSQ